MVNLKTLVLACTAALPTAALADWSGSYVGGSFGSVSGSTFDITSGVSASVDLEDTTSIGGYGGFLTQNGQLVYGAEIEVTSMPDMTGTTVVETADGPATFTVEHAGITVDLKGRVGFALDQVLAYGVVGVSTYTFENNAISEDFEQSGFSIGAGVDFLVTDNLFVGVEYLSRFPSGEVEIIGLDGSIEHESNVDTISIRAGYKF